jgi:hypothetical protein
MKLQPAGIELVVRREFLTSNILNLYIM